MALVLSPVLGRSIHANVNSLAVSYHSDDAKLSDYQFHDPKHASVSSREAKHANDAQNAAPREAKNANLRGPPYPPTPNLEKVFFL